MSDYPVDSTPLKSTFALSPRTTYTGIPAKNKVEGGADEGEEEGVEMDVDNGDEGMVNDAGKGIDEMEAVLPPRDTHVQCPTRVPPRVGLLSSVSWALAWFLSPVQA